MHGVTGSTLSGSLNRTIWLLIMFLVYFWVTFSRGLFMSSDNLVTSAKFLGSGMKWENSEPGFTKGKSCEISSTTVLKTLC